MQNNSGKSGQSATLRRAQTTGESLARSHQTSKATVTKVELTELRTSVIKDIASELQSINPNLSGEGLDMAILKELEERLSTAFVYPKKLPAIRTIRRLRTAE